MEFNGLIQHSFALRLARGHRPFVGADAEARIQERFSLPASGGRAFEVSPVCQSPTQAGAGLGTAEHSPLVRSGKTTVKPLSLTFSLTDGSHPSLPPLPPAFEWAGAGTGTIDPRQGAPTFVFAEVDPRTERVERNEYLVREEGCETEAHSISSALLEILAHKRSRLFGLALASRIVNVMLPHAVLTPVKGEGSSGGSWFVQPLVSLVRDGQVRSEFRDSYSLTLLLVPIKGAGFKQRLMTDKEIDLTVNAGWSLATVPTRTKPPRFRAKGPLLDYLLRLAEPCDPAVLLRGPGASPGGGCGGSLTLRQGTEILAFGLGLRLAQGSSGLATERTVRVIADDVVTSLGSARVSSVLTVGGVSEKEIRGNDPRVLRKHRELMVTISRETRRPSGPAKFRTYDLDRAFVDDGTYVVGVVPTKRCLVVSCALKPQHGWFQSGLMHAGSLAHMTVGAATAIGTLRGIDRDLEGLEVADPDKIAAIDAEIATDLREVYDLDITSEEYRSLYRLLCKRLGIARDYKSLQDKMATLRRSISTRHDVRAQRQLMWLTAAIVVLSVLIVAFAIAGALQ